MQRNIVVSVIFLAMTFSASAVTIDIRHEYLDDNKYHRDRIQVSHRFANGFGFFVEGKFKSGGNSADKPFSDIVDNGSEYSLNYTYQISPNSVFNPGWSLKLLRQNQSINPTFAVGIILIQAYISRCVIATNMCAKRRQVRKMNTLTAAISGLVIAGKI